MTLSSIAHLSGEIRFDDLMGVRAYSPMSAYTQSKGANLMFALELDRRLLASGKKAVSIACHRGYTNTNLQSTGPTGFFNLLYKITNPIFAQSGPEGALPTVLAAAGTEAKRGGYYGPQKMGEIRGAVGDAKVAVYVLNEETAKRLWDESERLVGHNWAQSLATLPTLINAQCIFVIRSSLPIVRILMKYTDGLKSTSPSAGGCATQQLKLLLMGKLS